jgi:hypothetical protein
MADKLDKLLADLKKKGDEINDAVEEYLKYQTKSKDRENDPDKYYKVCNQLNNDIIQLQNESDKILKSMQRWKKVIDKGKALTAVFDKLKALVKV